MWCFCWWNWKSWVMLHILQLLKFVHVGLLLMVPVICSENCAIFPGKSRRNSSSHCRGWSSNVVTSYLERRTILVPFSTLWFLPNCLVSVIRIICMFPQILHLRLFYSVMCVLPVLLSRLLRIKFYSSSHHQRWIIMDIRLDYDVHVP